MSNKIPRQKRVQEPARILRGMTSEEWKRHIESVKVEERKLHAELIANGFYKDEEKEKGSKPISNPFMTPRAIGTKSVAIF